MFTFFEFFQYDKDIKKPHDDVTYPPSFIDVSKLVSRDIPILAQLGRRKI